jgi:hypothetical protein
MSRKVNISAKEYAGARAAKIAVIIRGVPVGGFPAGGVDFRGLPGRPALPS